jgi:hypothetical protein
MDTHREVVASAFALAVIVNQLMEWDALAVSKPGPISQEWADALRQARANFALAMKKAEFAVSEVASKIPS